jgi:GxxExxY protein
MLHEELTERIIGVCFEVQNELGSGFVESVYQRALLIALREKGMNAKGQEPMKVLFRGHTVGEFVADVVVENKVIVELKAARELVPENHAQVLNYLKATGTDVGLLVNFGKPTLQVKRFHRNKAVQNGIL